MIIEKSPKKHITFVWLGRPIQNTNVQPVPRVAQYFFFICENTCTRVKHVRIPYARVCLYGDVCTVFNFFSFIFFFGHGCARANIYDSRVYIDWLNHTHMCAWSFVLMSCRYKYQARTKGIISPILKVSTEPASARIAERIIIIK